MMLPTTVKSLLLGFLGGIFGIFLLNLAIPKSLIPVATPSRFQSPAPARVVSELTFDIDKAKKILLPLHQFHLPGTLAPGVSSYALTLTSDGLVGISDTAREGVKFKVVSNDRQVYSLSPAFSAKGKPFGVPELGILFYNISGEQSPSVSPFGMSLYEQVKVGESLFEFLEGGEISIHRVVATYTTLNDNVIESSEAVVPTFLVDGEPGAGHFLFNSKGQLAGISKGGGRVISAEFIQNALRQYLDNQEYSPTWLGINFMDLNRTPPIPNQSTFGLLLTGTKSRPAVLPKSPAALSGLKARDVLISFDRRRLDSAIPFQLLLQRYPQGAKVELGIIREGKEQSVSVILGKQP